MRLCSKVVVLHLLLVLLLLHPVLLLLLLLLTELLTRLLLLLLSYRLLLGTLLWLAIIVSRVTKEAHHQLSLPFKELLLLSGLLLRCQPPSTCPCCTFPTTFTVACCITPCTVMS
jgi:hypothetical protein